MNKTQEALKLALEALENAEPKYTRQRKDQKTLGGALEYWKLEQWRRMKAITAIREALAEQLATTAKAVGMIEGQMYEDGTRAHNVVHWATRNAENDFPVGTLLYTHPFLPLNHEQRLDVMKEFEKHRMKWDDIAILIDLVEAKHGIGESK